MAELDDSDSSSMGMELEVADEAPPFPFEQLGDGLLQAVAQRLSEASRWRLERVDKRIAAVVRSNGYIYRNDLDVVVGVEGEDEGEDELAPVAQTICLGGFVVQLTEARAAAIALLARRRRVTRLRLDVATTFVALDWFDQMQMRQALVEVLAVLLGSDRLHLTCVVVDARFGRGLDGVQANVALLVLHHAATIAEMHVERCADDDGRDAEHKHAELSQAAAACTAMQRFSVRVGHCGCLERLARHCLPAFAQLRELDVEFDGVGEFDVDILPQPSQLQELRLNCGWPGSLTEAARARPDMFGSLRSLAINHYWDVLPKGFLDQLLVYCPRLVKLRLESLYDGAEPPYARSLVQQYFAAAGARRMRVKLIVFWQEIDDLEEMTVKSFESVCAKLLAGFHAAAPAVGVVCSDAQVFVYACGAVLNRAIAANPAVAALVGQAFIELQLAHVADAPAYTAVVSAAGALLANSAVAPAGVDGDVVDYAAAAPFYTAMAAAACADMQLAPELETDGSHGEVVFQLTRGDGDDKRQLDVIVRKYEVD